MRSRTHPYGAGAVPVPECYIAQVSQTSTSQALLLRAVDYRESDRIVTLLTPRMGMVSAMARGARTSRRRFGGALSPFCVLEVQLTATRSDMFRLDQAQVVRPCMRILADLSRMNAAGALLDLVRRMAAAQSPDEVTYEVCTAALLALDDCPQERILLQRVGTAAQLLALAGWQPDLSKCGLCLRVPGQRQPAQLDPAAGHLVCRRCGGAPVALSPAARNALQAMLSDGAAPELALDREVVQAVDHALTEIVRCQVND